MKNNKHETNRHHLLPQSLGGSNEAPNVERWRKYYHDALHAVFGNDHTQEKLGRIVSLDEAILTDRFKNVIHDIMGMSPQDIYKIECFKNKHNYKSLNNKYDG